MTATNHPSLDQGIQNAIKAAQRNRDDSNQQAQLLSDAWDQFKKHTYKNVLHSFEQHVQNNNGKYDPSGTAEIGIVLEEFSGRTLHGGMTLDLNFDHRSGMVRPSISPMTGGANYPQAIHIGEATEEWLTGAFIDLVGNFLKAAP